MLLHVIKYRFKCIIKEKTVVFWILVFPIILATFFHLAFANIFDDEKIEPIKTAIINSTEIPDAFLDSIKKSELFDIQMTTRKEADDLLAKGKISGYIEYNKDIKLTVSKSGINESIIKIFLDRYAQVSSTITNIITNNPDLMQSDFIENINFDEQYTKEKPLNGPTNIVVIYFYTLIAMTCLFNASLGIFDVIQIQANQSAEAARINAAPTHKFKIFLGYTISAVTFNFLSTILVLIYTSKILHVDYGNRVGYIILLCFISCVTGEFMGTMISALIKKSEGIKSAIVLSIIMLGNFLAGMMAVNMKYIVQQKFPLISYINLSNLITDGLYSLYYYNNLNRYFLNLGILSIFAVIFAVVTYLVLRRQKYASL